MEGLGSGASVHVIGKPRSPQHKREPPVQGNPLLLSTSAWKPLPAGSGSEGLSLWNVCFRI